MWRNMVQLEDNTIRLMCIACWVTKATHTYTHTQTFGLCKAYYYFATTVVTRTRVSVTFIRVWSVFDVYWTVHHCDNWRIKDQLDVTCYFIVLLIGSTCFGYNYAYHLELANMMLITTLVVSFLVCCMLEVRCSKAGVVSRLQAQVLFYPAFRTILQPNRT